MQFGGANLDLLSPAVIQLEPIANRLKRLFRDNPAPLHIRDFRPLDGANKANRYSPITRRTGAGLGCLLIF